MKLATAILGILMLISITAGGPKFPPHSARAHSDNASYTLVKALDIKE